MTTENSFRELLKQLREQRGLTQEELAKLSGVSRSYISRLELETFTDISADKIANLARAVKVKPEIFFQAGGYIRESRTSIAKGEVEAVVRSLLLEEIPIIGLVPSISSISSAQKIENYVTIPKDELKTVSRKLFGLRVVDDSLSSDDIHYGDILIIEPTQDILDGKIYILRINNEVVARHIFKEAGKLKLVSCSSKIPVINAAEADVLGRVILAGGWKEF